jgi:hypothetical protein
MNQEDRNRRLIEAISRTDSIERVKELLRPWPEPSSEIIEAAINQAVFLAKAEMAETYGID